MEARSVLKKMVSKLWNYDVGAHCLFNVNSQARDSYFHGAEIPSAREHIFSRALAPPSRLIKSWGYLFQMIGRMSCQLLAALPLSDPLLTVLFPQTTNQTSPAREYVLFHHSRTPFLFQSDIRITLPSILSPHKSLCLDIVPTPRSSIWTYLLHQHPFFPSSTPASSPCMEAFWAQRCSRTKSLILPLCHAQKVFDLSIAFTLISFLATSFRHKTSQKSTPSTYNTSTAANAFERCFLASILPFNPQTLSALQHVLTSVRSVSKPPFSELAFILTYVETVSSRRLGVPNSTF